MRIDPYKRVLGVPGIRAIYGLNLLARIPVTAAPTALTLRVVLGMHRGFAASGLVAATVALGAAAGSPLIGRMIDDRGARATLALTTAAQIIFWSAAFVLPYVWLVPAAFIGGALTLPVFSLARQTVAALLPPGDRQAGLSLDSMSVEVSFSIGPALGVVAVTRLGSAPAMLVIGAAVAVAGLGLIALDAPTVGSEEDKTAGEGRVSGPANGLAADGLAADGRGLDGRTDSRQPARWLTATTSAALLATAGATFTLSGTDIGLTASMRAFGHVGLLGVVVATWSMASLLGGFTYGMLHRRREPLILLILLATLTVLLALAGSWWALLLLAIPSGLFCAPLLSSTAEVMTRVAPERRGRSLGLHTSALTLGNAAGAPLAGAAVDRWSPAGGFITVGVSGAVLAAVALVAVHLRRGRRAPRGETMTEPALR